jgi:hypothetical protein
LSESNQFGRRFGIHLTTVEHRLEMTRLRRLELEDFVPAGARSEEQLAPLMAALLGDAPGQFVVNLPNHGQIENLPRGAVVECLAYADGSGVWPIGTGALSPAVHAVVAPHVDRQELIVEAALSGRYELAKTALATDPLVQDPMVVEPLFKELIAANSGFIYPETGAVVEMDHNRSILDTEIERINAETVLEASQEEAKQVSSKLSTATTTIQELLENPVARPILEQHFPGMIDNPQLKVAYGMTLKQVAPFAPQILTDEKLSSVDEALSLLDQD